MVVTDAHGWPIGIDLFSANFHEASLVEPTLLESMHYLPKPKNLLGDKAYSSLPLTKRVYRKYHIYLTAPPKRHYVNPFHDGRRLRRGSRRWKVERTYSWFKYCRRLECRWEVKPENYLGFAQLACSMLLVKHAFLG